MVQSLRRKIITFRIAIKKTNVAVAITIPLTCATRKAISFRRHHRYNRSIATDIVRFSFEECMRSLNSAVSRCLQSCMQACEKARIGFSQSFSLLISHHQKIVRVTRLPFAMQFELHVNVTWGEIVIVVYINQKSQRRKSLAVRQKTRNSITYERENNIFQ